VAVRVTAVFRANVAEHVAPQFIPAGELVTVPVPVPVFVTARVTRLKFAETDWASLIVRVHVPVPLHAPDQPVKDEF
jgi:hypothetical protein